MVDLSAIKITMTLAMVFYTAAIIVGRSQKKRSTPRYAHVSLASLGFVLDMYATYLMSMADASAVTVWMPLLIFHTIVSLLAIFAFCAMLTLGATKKITHHRRFVYFGFVPTWLCAYVSGIVLIT